MAVTVRGSAPTAAQKQAFRDAFGLQGTDIASNQIGTPGAAGFGVGVCPAPPVGYTPLSGHGDPASANYGNYQYADGSIMCWIPAFYFRLGHASNPTYATYGVNSIDIKPLSAFASEAVANASSYYLHRAFVNAGANQLGFFRDKYDCSANGSIASSLPLAMPMVSGPTTGQVGFVAVTGGANAYYGSITAAKSRGAKFFPTSVFIMDALNRISEAHAQASTSATYCAWYDATGVKNFPKGNNNALKDIDELTTTFTSAGAAGAASMALTGSGAPLAKTTHNGQACGITDVNGNIYKILIGMTCVATSKTITAATQANPVVVSAAAHGRTTGDIVAITGVGGMTQLNDRVCKVTVVDVDRIALDGVDGSAFSAFTTGGNVSNGVFYALKNSVDIAAVTEGTTTATDHWSSAGVAAQFDQVTLNFVTTYPSNTATQRFGDGANAVFDMSTANARALSMLGLPAVGGMSSAGSNAMGLDYYYQHVVNQMCAGTSGSWNGGTTAGARLRNLSGGRTTSSIVSGFACASYL